MGILGYHNCCVLYIDVCENNDFIRSLYIQVTHSHSLAILVRCLSPCTTLRWCSWFPINLISFSMGHSISPALPYSSMFWYICNYRKPHINATGIEQTLQGWGWHFQLLVSFFKMMKMPERSRTSCLGYFKVLLPKWRRFVTSYDGVISCDDVIWRSDITP